MIKFNELKKRREGAIGCPSDTRNPDHWDWDNWENWPEKDKLAYPLKESTNKRENTMKECNELFIDKWHDTCEVLPDGGEDVWFIADGQYCVGVYEPEQKVFCMADSMGVELKNVRQWKYVGVDKQIAKYPTEKQVIAAFIPGIPCLITGIFSDHCINESNGDEFSGLILNETYNFVDPGFADVIPWTKVNYWYYLPEEPITILEPIGDSFLTVMPAAETVIDDCTGTCEEPKEGTLEPEFKNKYADDAIKSAGTESEIKEDNFIKADQPVELGQDSMDSPEVKSAIIKASKRPFTEKYNYGDLQNLNRFFKTAIKELNKAIDYLKDNPSCKDENPEAVIDALGKAVAAVIKAKQKIGPLKESADSLNVYEREDLQFVYAKISNALDALQDEGLMYAPYYEDLLSAQNVLGEFIKYNNLDESKMKEGFFNRARKAFNKFILDERDKYYRIAMNAAEDLIKKYNLDAKPKYCGYSYDSINLYVPKGKEIRSYRVTIDISKKDYDKIKDIPFQSNPSASDVVKSGEFGKPFIEKSMYDLVVIDVFALMDKESAKKDREKQSKIYNRAYESKMRESLATISDDAYLKYRALESKGYADEIFDYLNDKDLESAIEEVVINHHIDMDEWKKLNFYESKKRMKEDYGWEVEYGHEWDLYDEMLEAFGAEELCESLARAMGLDELRDNLAYIARMNDFRSEYLGNVDEDFEESKKMREASGNLYAVKCNLDKYKGWYLADGRDSDPSIHGLTKDREKALKFLTVKEARETLSVYMQNYFWHKNPKEVQEYLSKLNMEEFNNDIEIPMDMAINDWFSIFIIHKSTYNFEESKEEKLSEKNWKYKISKDLANKFNSLIYKEVTPDYDDCRQVILDILKQAKDFVGEEDWYYDSTIDDLEYADLEDDADVNWYIGEMYDILDSYDIWLSPFEEAKGSKNIRLKETRLYYDLSDGSYKPWSGAVDTWNKIEDADKIDALDAYLEDLYPKGLSETELNDILWFDGDSILEYLGLSTEDEEDEEEEDIEEDDEEDGDRDGYIIASGDDGKLHKYDLDGNLLESFKDYHLDAIPENLAQKALAYLTHIKEN